MQHSYKTEHGRGLVKEIITSTRKIRLQNDNNLGWQNMDGVGLVLLDSYESVVTTSSGQDICLDLTTRDYWIVDLVLVLRDIFCMFKF
jgi:hypothetical protein